MAYRFVTLPRVCIAIPKFCCLVSSRSKIDIERVKSWLIGEVLESFGKIGTIAVTLTNDIQNFGRELIKLFAASDRLMGHDNPWYQVLFKPTRSNFLSKLFCRPLPNK